jgi:hypothetical protein
VNLPYMFCPRQVDDRIAPRIRPMLVVQVQDPFSKRGCESEGLGDHISATATGENMTGETKTWCAVSVPHHMGHMPVLVSIGLGCVLQVAQCISEPLPNASQKRCTMSPSRGFDNFPQSVPDVRDCVRRPAEVAQTACWSHH